MESVDPADVERHRSQPGKLLVRTLFQGKYLRRTVVTWTMWFFSMDAYCGLFVWLPSLLAKMSHSLDNAFLQIMLIQFF